MCYLITHPEVVVDASVPVDQWSLSPVGRARAGRLGRLPWTAHLDRVIISAERKAVETAEILARTGGFGDVPCYRCLGWPSTLVASSPTRGTPAAGCRVRVN